MCFLFRKKVVVVKSVAEAGREMFGRVAVVFPETASETIVFLNIKKQPGILECFTLAASQFVISKGSAESVVAVKVDMPLKATVITIKSLVY